MTNKQLDINTLKTLIWLNSKKVLDEEAVQNALETNETTRK